MRERLEVNIQILDELKRFFKENPNQRFGQGLYTSGIFTRVQPNKNDFSRHFYSDEAFTESIESLKRLYDQRITVNKKGA